MYFHYTNRSGAVAIDQSGYIQPSVESGAFGPGVYLTDLHPKAFFRNEILMNNYGGIRSNFESRADWVVEVLEKHLNMQLLRKIRVPGGRRIFVYPYSIAVSSDQIYDKPRCFKGCDEINTSSSDDEFNYDSGDDVSDEFDTDGELDESEGGFEENEESDGGGQMDGTGSCVSGYEENGCSAYDSDEHEDIHCTSAEEESRCDSADIVENEIDGISGEEYDTDGCSASADCECDSDNGCHDGNIYCYDGSDDDSY